VPHPSLLQALQTTASFAALSRGLPKAGDSVVAAGLAGSSPAVLIGALHRERPERIWVAVAPTPEAAEHLIADLESILGEDAALLYPQRESLPYEAAEPHVEIGGLRVETLEALLTGRASILVTTQRAVQERSPISRSAPRSSPP
jgi:transcription-repair coupling factor (superfamily II helicase)